MQGLGPGVRTIGRWGGELKVSAWIPGPVGADQAWRSGESRFRKRYAAWKRRQGEGR